MTKKGDPNPVVMLNLFQHLLYRDVMTSSEKGCSTEYSCKAAQGGSNEKDGFDGLGIDRSPSVDLDASRMPCRGDD
jgi:hypothetical protein